MAMPVLCFVGIMRLTTLWQSPQVLQNKERIFSMARGVSTVNNFFCLRELKDIYKSYTGFSFKEIQDSLNPYANTTLSCHCSVV